MSTKIYNAFKIKANSLDEVIQLFFSKKEDITQDIEEQILKDILKEMINNFDRFSLAGHNLIKEDGEKNKLNYETTVHSMIMDKFWDRNKKEDSDKDDNIESSFILYPQSIDYFGEKSYLMQVFIENKIIDILQEKYFKEWKISEYDYWNNTDQPDTITDYEWNLRKNHWKNIDRPLFAGMSITFVKANKYEIYMNYGYSYKKEQVKTIISSLNKEFNLEKRIEKNVFAVKEEIAYKENYDKFIISNNLENVVHEKLVDAIMSKGMGVYMDSIRQAKDNKFNEDQLAIIKEKENLIKLLLKEEIVVEDFQMKGEDIKNLAQSKLTKKFKMK